MHAMGYIFRLTLAEYQLFVPETICVSILDPLHKSICTVSSPLTSMGLVQYSQYIK